MGRTEEQPPGLGAWRRRRLRSRLGWAVPLVVLLLGGAVASAGAARDGLRRVQPGDRGAILAGAVVAAVLGYAASWLLALDYERRTEDGRITAEYRVLIAARVAASFLIVFFLNAIGPAATTVMSSFLAGVLVATALVVALWTLDRAPFRSPPPDRLSDGTWI